MRARVEPGDSARELFDVQFPAFEVGPVDVGDLELSARRGFEPRRDIEHAVVVEVQARHGIGRLRPRRLFLEADGPPGGIELDDTVTFRVAHAITEDGRPSLTCGCLSKVIREVRTVEEVVSESESHATAPDKLAADDERLSQPLRAWLNGVPDAQSDFRAVPEQALESADVARSADDEDVPNACEHQRGQRVVHHRLVVDRQELLADHTRQRVEACTRPAGQDDAFHRDNPSRSRS